MVFAEFWRKYKVLSESFSTTPANLSVEKVKSAVQDLLEELDLDKTAVRLGNTQVRESKIYAYALQTTNNALYIYIYIYSNLSRPQI